MNEPQPFEKSLVELEGILRALEDGSTTLEASLTQYERGVALLKSCYDQLQNAEQRIVALSGVDADGKPRWKQFDHASAELGADAKRSPARPKAKKSEGMY